MTPSETRLKFRVHARLSEIAHLRERLRKFLAASSLHMDERSREEVTLGLDEAATNIVVHGYGNGGGIIDVEYEDAGDSLVIRLWDDGAHRIDADCIGLPPHTPGEGGMGTGIMRASFTALSYESEGDRNLLVLRRHLDHRCWTDEDEQEKA